MTQEAGTLETGRLFDEYLVLATQGGNRAAGERLAARWRPRLLRTARRLLGDPALAEEAVQETWLGLVRGLARLDDPSRFPAYVFRILHRRCADIIRRKVKDRGRIVDDDRALEGASAFPDSDRGGAELRTSISAAFAALPPDQRTAAALYFGENLTVAEIAHATGTASGTVKSRLFHARRKLRSMLEGDLS